MIAAQLTAFGEPLVLREVADPVPGPDEVVVEVDLGGLNPLDLRICAGGGGRVELPFLPGLDAVGRLPGTGSVAVYGGNVGVTRSGTWAERIAVPRDAVVPLPAGVRHTEAAAIGLAGVTAWGIVRAAGIDADDRVLVLGASGGVGTLVVQLAARTGATVWSHVSHEADEAVQRRFGAPTVVRAEPPDLQGAVRDLRPSVVVDGLGGAFTAATVRALSPGGRIVVYGTPAGRTAELDLSTLYRKEAKLLGHATLRMSTARVRRALGECLDLLANGELRVQVDATVSLADVNDAMRRLAARDVSGKLLLAPSA